MLDMLGRMHEREQRRADVAGVLGNVVEHHVRPDDGAERQLLEDAQAGDQVLGHRIAAFAGLEVHRESRRAIQRVAGEGGRQGEVKRRLARAQGEGLGAVLRACSTISGPIRTISRPWSTRAPWPASSLRARALRKRTPTSGRIRRLSRWTFSFSESERKLHCIHMEVVLEVVGPIQPGSTRHRMAANMPRKMNDPQAQLFGDALPNCAQSVVTRGGA